MKASLRAAFHHARRLLTLHRSSLSVLALLFIALAPLGAWTLFEDFESHQWENPGWNDSWDRIMPVSYGTYQGRQCMKVTGPTTNWAGHATYEPVVTSVFADENWSNVISVKLDVYTEADVTDMNVSLEPRDRNVNPCVPFVPTYTIASTGTWVTYSWNYSVSASSPVAKLHLIFNNLGANAATFYVDNLRLVLNDGTTHYWDDFDDQSLKWSVGGSTAVWSATPEYITHNASTSTANGGAACLWWDYNGTAYAQLMPSGVDENWRSENVLRADVRCTTTTIPITFFFWYGGWGEETSPRYVTQADTWQTLYWDLPPGTTNNNVIGLNPRVKPDALKPSGTFYIDNICIGRTQISVAKSTSTASARPGDEITYTITYGNPGADDVTNLSINDVIPFNAVLSAEPGPGNADAVEYYVGSSWMTTYSASATRIRWRDDLVATGEGGRIVSYKVKPK